MRFSFGSLESLVGREVGLFVHFQTATVVGSVVAALMVTLVCPGSLVFRQVGLLMFFQIVRPTATVAAARMVTMVHLGLLGSLVGRQVRLFVLF